MTTYYSSFTSGLSEIIKDALAGQLSDVKIDLILDGLIVYQSDRPVQQIRRIRFFNNTFLLIHLFKELRPDSIPFMMNAILKKPELVNVPRWIVKGKAFFRIMVSRENQTVPINREVLAHLESYFAYKLRLRVNRSKPDIEVWFLERSEGYGFVGIRLTQNSPSEKNLQRGELRPELANILCLISEPWKEDIFLDPFAGSGAIPIERAKYFPYKEIIASDHDKETVHKLRNRISKLGLKIHIRQWDALKLEEVRDSSIDKIVTDPPWGIYTSQATDILGKFFLEMLRQISRVLKEDGIAVLLMGQKEIFENSLKNYPDVILIDKKDILVSGKKAAIYKIKKRSPG